MKKSLFLTLSVFLLLSASAFSDGSAAASRTTVEKAANTSIKKATGLNAVTVEEAFRDSADSKPIRS